MNYNGLGMSILGECVCEGYVAMEYLAVSVSVYLY